MKLSASSALALFLAYAGLVAAAPPEKSNFALFVHASGEEGDKGHLAIGAKGEACGSLDHASKALNAESSVVCMDWIGSIKNWKDVKLDQESTFEMLIQYFSRTYTDETTLANRNIIGLSEMVKLINKNNIDAISKLDAFFLIADLIKPEVLANISEPVTALKAIQKGKSVPQEVAFMKSLNSAVGGRLVKENASELLKAIGDNIGEYPVEVVTNLINADTAADISDAQMNALIASKAHAGILKPVHFQAIAEIAKKNEFAQYAHNLPLDTVKGFDNFHADVIAKMSVEQMKVLGSGITAEGEKICKTVPLAEASLFVNGHEMTPRCFHDAAESLGEGKTAISKAWRILPENILSGVKENEVLDKIGADEWKYISEAQKAHLFKHTELCEHIPKEALMHHADLEVPTECFLKMKPETMSYAIIGSKLDGKALSTLNAEQVGNFKYGEDEGLAIFNHAIFRPNIAELIENLSEKTENEHACSIIEDFEKFKKYTALQDFASKSCISKVAVKWDFDKIKDISPRAASMINTEALIDDLQDDGYKNMSTEDFSNLEETICGKITLERFNMLNEDVLKEMSAKGFNKLTFHASITKDKLALIKASIFASVDADVMAKIPIENLSEEQIVSAAAGGWPTKWTTQTVGDLAASISKIPHSAWGKCPADAYAGFTATTFAQLAPESMVEMSQAQLAKVPADVRKTLTAAQAASVGSKVIVADVDKDHPLVAFKDGEMAADVKTVVDGRLAKAKEAPKVEEAKAEAPKSEGK